MPVSGSAYTFSYATLGELVAWIIGWDLLLELMLGASVVAQGWSTYLTTLLGNLGITWPEAVGSGSHFDLGAFLLVVVLTALIASGIKESMRVNMVLVALKLFIVLFVIVAGLGFIDTRQLRPVHPARPARRGGSGLTAPLIQVLFGSTPTTYGVLGIVAGASIVFFAYIGFDVVATTAEEARNPQRDLPIGILASLMICTVLYWRSPWSSPGWCSTTRSTPRRRSPRRSRRGQGRLRHHHRAGAVAGLTTVVMTLLIGATRVQLRDVPRPPPPAAAGPDQPQDRNPRAADRHDRHRAWRSSRH